MTPTRLPPQSRDAEQSVLGSMLRLPSVIDEVAVILREDDFYSDAHQKVWAAIMALHGRSRVDLLTLAEELRQRGHIEDVGGYGYLGELYEAAPTAANAEYYARIVRERALVRHLIQVSTEILRDAYDQVAPADEMLGNAERLILAIRDRSQADSGPMPLSGPLDASIERLQDRQERGRPINGLTTTLQDVDDILGGLRNGELITIAARPSVGKSSLAIQIAIGVAQLGVPVFFSTLEMSSAEISDRLLCTHSGVPSHHYRGGALSDQEIDKIVNAHHRLRTAPIWIDDTPVQTASRFANSVRRLKRRACVGLAITDYLQIMEPENRKVGRVEQIGDMTRIMKRSARESRIPVVELCQLNREADEGRPRLRDLREGGSIENDSDVVMLMWREGENGNVSIEIKKNRNGPTGIANVLFVAQTTRFENLPRSRYL